MNNKIPFVNAKGIFFLKICDRRLRLKSRLHLRQRKNLHRRIPRYQRIYVCVFYLCKQHLHQRCSCLQRTPTFVCLLRLIRDDQHAQIVVAAVPIMIPIKMLVTLCTPKAAASCFVDTRLNPARFRSYRVSHLAVRLSSASV